MGKLNRSNYEWFESARGGQVAIDEWGEGHPGSLPGSLLLIGLVCPNFELYIIPDIEIPDDSCRLIFSCWLMILAIRNDLEIMLLCFYNLKDVFGMENRFINVPKLVS
jgi:hypothetical protein